MLICEYEWDTQFMHPGQGRNKDCDFVVGHLPDTSIPRLDVEHHDGEGREVERNVVAQRATRRNGNLSPSALGDEIAVTDVATVRIGLSAIGRVQAMIENPWQIVAMHDAKNQRLVRIQVGRHGRRYSSS